MAVLGDFPIYCTLNIRCLDEIGVEEVGLTMPNGERPPVPTIEVDQLALPNAPRMQGNLNTSQGTVSMTSTTVLAVRGTTLKRRYKAEDRRGHELSRIVFRTYSIP